MVGSFVLCYAPYAITAMWFANAEETNKDYRLVAIPAFFSKSSCVYNPLIYAFMNKQFNACIMETVFGKKMEESSEVSSKTETSSVSAAWILSNTFTDHSIIHILYFYTFSRGKWCHLVPPSHKATAHWMYPFWYLHKVVYLFFVKCYVRIKHSSRIYWIKNLQ